MKMSLLGYNTDIIPSGFDGESFLKSFVFSPETTSAQVAKLIIRGEIKKMSKRDLNKLNSILETSVSDLRKSLGDLKNSNAYKTHPGYKAIVKKFKDLHKNYGVEYNIGDIEELSTFYSLKISNLISDFGYHILTPEKIKQYLDRYVSGQDAAKQSYALLFYNHLLRCGLLGEKVDPKKLPANNLCVVGPTGSGKSYMASLLANLMDDLTPYVHCNISSFTSSGYIGDDMYSVFTTALLKSNGDKQKAQNAIIVIDEVDKIAVSSSDAQRDHIGTLAIQQEFLNILEGGIINVHEKHHHHSEKIQFDTSNICFILAGAFVGLDKIVNRNSGISNLGFKSTSKKIQESTKLNFNSDHLISYGLIPEVVGRINSFAELHQLTSANIKEILTSSKNSALSKYEEYFRLHSVELRFDDSAFDVISETVGNKGLGARYLNTLLSNILRDFQFLAPSMKGSEIVITRDIVLEKIGLTI